MVDSSVIAPPLSLQRGHLDLHAALEARGPRIIDVKPVEILRDRRGVYGVGITEENDLEALAWACGVDPLYVQHTPPPLILRPDRFEFSEPRGGDAALQMITGGFRHGPFVRCIEEKLRSHIHHEALQRAGLPWPPPEPHKYWSADKTEQDRNRKIYHGLRRLSLSIINQMICGVIEAAADPVAIRAARRFPFSYRQQLYRASAQNLRALQFADVFPLAALAIYTDFSWTEWRPRDYQAERKFEKNAASVAAQLVERGARLRDVAAALDMPSAFRRVKPGAAHLVSSLIRRPQLLRWLPETTQEQRLWLVLTDYAQRHGGPDFAGWVARHVSEMLGSTLNERGDNVANLLDWVEACAPPGKLITRPFAPSMSLRTATKLSAGWHEAVANSQDTAEGLAFPKPWVPAAAQGPFEIVPLTSATELFHEGAAMHHCVRAYANRVRAGEVYVYSVRRNSKRLATVSLCRHYGQVLIEQIRGPCNAVSHRNRSSTP